MAQLSSTYVEDKPLTPTPASQFNMKVGRKPRILVVNDDGIKSSGLKQLALALEEIGDVVVVSTIDNQIHPSFSITIQEQIRAKRVDIWGSNILTYAVTGFPMNCLKFAYGYVIPNVLKWDTLDIVIAGINKGRNVGTDLLYSGTMSLACAARFGNESFMQNNKTPKSIAISLCPPAMMSTSSMLSAQFVDWQFDEAVEISTTITRLLLESEQTPNVVWNVNIPPNPKRMDEKYCWAVTKPADLEYDPNNLITITKDDEKLNYHDFKINPPLTPSLKQYAEGIGSDLNALKNNIISISPIEVSPALHTPLHATNNLINFITNNDEFYLDSKYLWEISVNIRPLKCIVQCLQHWLELKERNNNVNNERSLLQTYTLYLERDIKICGEKHKFSMILTNQFEYDENAEKFNNTLTWNELNQLYDVLNDIEMQTNSFQENRKNNVFNIVLKGAIFTAVTGVVIYSIGFLRQTYLTNAKNK